MDIRSVGNAMQSGQFLAQQTSAPPSQTLNVNGLTATSVENSSTPQKTSPSEEAVHKAVSDINKAIQNFSQGLQFSVDKDTQRVVVKIVDQQTNQVIKQIPTEEALEISKSLSKLQGLLVKHEA
ncbi:flagellar protein FlaG [Undibacterium luofuense]|uniref:Flagellar protein FlaG n=1 Tax=Undibacterium luofuense TaxID=2828733 RepID=A0A941DS44_9BURK|nr:flagellar protein FlaG [Undibacterium luofuense]MBR7783031.1 flagellar protein FlaG [Undibacterium luofuense]